MMFANPIGNTARAELSCIKLLNSGPDFLCMKLKWLALFSALAVVVVFTFLTSAPAKNAGSSIPFMALSSVPVPEIPAKAADLVRTAAVSDREQTAQDVLRAVSVIARPGVLPYVVSAICRAAPEAAGSVVETAAELQPEDVLIFSQAALCAAPSQVEQIVFAACTVEPASWANLVLVASRQLPSADNLILAGLVSALPGQQIYLEKAERQVGTNDFEAVISNTVQLVADYFKAQSQ
jgi:hypothetical protein